MKKKLKIKLTCGDCFYWHLLEENIGVCRGSRNPVMYFQVGKKAKICKAFERAR